MALGDFSMFSWKNKEQREREQQEYEQWAFPYGQEQRGKLESLMRELRPKERAEFIMMGYLTCKELYERYLKKFGSRDEAVDYMVNEEKKYKQLINKKDMTMYIAIVLADAAVDERCEYASADEIRESILELDRISARNNR